MTKFVDTTIQVSRIVEANDDVFQSAIATVIAGESVMACAFSRLEFKRVVIQNIHLALRYILTEKSIFAAIRRANRLRRDRQCKMLVSILMWAAESDPSEFESSTGDEQDQQLTLQAEAFLRNAIEYCWHRYAAIVLSVVNHIDCRRGEEAPRRTRSGGFDVAIPKTECSKRSCGNKVFFQERMNLVRSLQKRLRENSNELTDELRAALDVLDEVLARGKLHHLYDYNKCVTLGDVWVHLECVASGIKEFVTTNYKESDILCPMLDLEPRIVTKPPPKKLKRS